MNRDIQVTVVCPVIQVIPAGRVIQESQAIPVIPARAVGVVIQVFLALVGIAV